MDGRKYNTGQTRYYYNWHGKMHSVPQIAKITGLTTPTLYARLRRHNFDIDLCTDGWNDYITRPREKEEVAPEEQALRICRKAVTKFCSECLLYDGKKGECTWHECRLFEAFKLLKKRYLSKG